jgi:hypothetical protein
MIKSHQARKTRRKRRSKLPLKAMMTLKSNLYTSKQQRWENKEPRKTSKYSTTSLMKYSVRRESQIKPLKTTLKCCHIYSFPEEYKSIESFANLLVIMIVEFI